MYSGTVACNRMSTELIIHLYIAIANTNSQQNRMLYAMVPTPHRAFLFLDIRIRKNEIVLYQHRLQDSNIASHVTAPVRKPPCDC